MNVPKVCFLFKRIFYMNTLLLKQLRPIWQNTTYCGQVESTPVSYPGPSKFKCSDLSLETGYPDQAVLFSSVHQTKATIHEIRPQMLSSTFLPVHNSLIKSVHPQLNTSQTRRQQTNLQTSHPFVTSYQIFLSKKFCKTFWNVLYMFQTCYSYFLTYRKQ